MGPRPGRSRRRPRRAGGRPWLEVSSIEDLLALPAPDVARTGLPVSSEADAAMPAAEMTAIQRARARSRPSPPSRPTRPRSSRAPNPRSSSRRRSPTVRSLPSAAPRPTSRSPTRPGSGPPSRWSPRLGRPAHQHVRDHPRLGTQHPRPGGRRPGGPPTGQRPPQVVSFPVGPLAPGTEVSFKVPVRAIGSGDVGVEVELLAVPEGVVIAPSSDFVVRVRADWETVGTAVFAGFVALLMIGGLWRTIRRGRSPRRVAELTPRRGAATGTRPRRRAPRRDRTDEARAPRGVRRLTLPCPTTERRPSRCRRHRAGGRRYPGLDHLAGRTRTQLDAHGVRHRCLARPRAGPQRPPHHRDRDHRARRRRFRRREQDPQRPLRDPRGRRPQRGPGPQIVRAFRSRNPQERLDKLLTLSGVLLLG
ncbi:DUF6049 family protein [Oerskovia sp. M15]